MPATCLAKIRPFTGDTEVQCELEDDGHSEHAGILRGYAYTGSETKIVWWASDRRTFVGDWPGQCSEACPLPFGHHGNHVR